MQTTTQLTGLAGLLVDLIASLGAVGVGIAVFAENLFPPIPSESVLPLAGFVSSQGDMSLVGVIVWSTLGSVVGALALYGIGAWLGEERLVELWERMPLADGDDVRRGRAWFDDHGDRSVLIGRCVPVVRSVVSIPAGVTRMPLVRFTLLTTIGSGIWNTIFVVLGYQLGSQWESVGAYSSWFNYAIIAAILGAIAWGARNRLRERHG